MQKKQRRARSPQSPFIKLEDVTPPPLSAYPSHGKRHSGGQHRTPSGKARQQAAQITVPALVIFGDHDRLVNPRLAKSARRAFRDATVMVLPRTGHVAQMQHPELLAARFREMADSADPRASGDGNAGRRDPVDA